MNRQLESCKKSVVKAIENKSLISYINEASIEEEVKRTNCIYDIIHYDGISRNDIKAEVIKCLTDLNQGLNQNMKLTDNMIIMIVDLVLNDFNGLTLVGFFRCMRKGLKGDYGKVYQMNVLTVTDWIQQYLSSEEYMERIYKLRRKHDRDKSEELNKMYAGDMLDVMKQALKISEKKPVEYKPKQIHLDQFANVVKLFNEEELEQAIKDWSKRQRPQYLEILEKEKKSRK